MKNARDTCSYTDSFVDDVTYGKVCLRPRSATTLNPVTSRPSRLSLPLPNCGISYFLRLPSQYRSSCDQPIQQPSQGSEHPSLPSLPHYLSARDKELQHVFFAPTEYLRNCLYAAINHNRHLEKTQTHDRKHTTRSSPRHCPQARRHMAVSQSISAPSRRSFCNYRRARILIFTPWKIRTRHRRFLRV